MIPQLGSIRLARSATGAASGPILLYKPQGEFPGA